MTLTLGDAGKKAADTAKALLERPCLDRDAAGL